MIDVNSLRLGNIICTPEGIEKVIAIKINYVFTDSGRYGKSFIKPVPLFIDDIKKAGFKSYAGGFILEKVFIKKRVNKNSFQLGFNTWVIKDVINTHEFQNIYQALTDLELSIK